MLVTTMEPGDVFVVTLRVVNFDAAVARSVRRDLSAPLRRGIPVVLDVKGVKFSDSSGLGTLCALHELFEALRARYSMILVIGPPPWQPVEFELLAAHSDAIIFHAVDRLGLGPFEASWMGDLGTRGALVLGAVVGQVDRTPARRAGRPSHAAKRTRVRRNVVT